MEKAVARLPEHHAQLLIVVGHQGGFWGLLGQLDQAVNVLHCFECLLQSVMYKTMYTYYFLFYVLRLFIMFGYSLIIKIQID